MSWNSTISKTGEKDAIEKGYKFIRIEGYIMAADGKDDSKRRRKRSQNIHTLPYACKDVSGIIHLRFSIEI
jgi:hypothetical protein